MNESSKTNTAAPLPPPKPTVEQPRLADFYPGLGVWITWAIALGAATLLRWYIDHLDWAVVNGATGGAGLACFIAPFVWYVWTSKYPLAARRGVFWTVVGSLGMLLLFVRVDRFDGRLVPEFRWVWQSPRDRLLGNPLAAKGAAPVASDDPAANNDVLPPLLDEVGYPQFLGPQRNAVLEGPRLKTDWTADPPKMLWRQPIGAGWAAFAAHSQLAVTLEQRGDEEWVTCYHVPNGKVAWGHSVPGRHEETMGGVGPRSTPTIHAGRVYTLGANGHLHCFDLRTGKVLWQQQLLSLVGVKEGEDQNAVLWGRSASPLIYGDLVVVPAGGPNGKDQQRTSLIAFDKTSGDIVWRGGDQQVGYSSPTIARLHGVEQILIVNEATVAGHDPQTGAELWQYKWFGSSTGTASVAQPHAIDNNRVLITKGYGGGLTIFRVDRAANGKWSVVEEHKNPAALKTKFTNVAVLDGHAYALSDTILECVNLADGKAKWKKGRYGQGQLLAVGKLLLIQCESGEVALAEANPERPRELTRFAAIQGITWNNPCLYGRLLLVRNGDEAACYELPVEE